MALPERLKLEKPNPLAQTSIAKLSEGRQRLPVNVLSNITWLAINIVVGLWYTPYLIGHLGIAVYGLVPLVNSVTNYMTLLTDGFNSAISRFLTIDLARDDAEAANRTFNTAVAGSLTMAAILLIMALVFSWWAPQIFNMPTGYERDLQWLVLFTIGGFIITAFASSFAISSYAYHRFDLRLLVNIIRLMVQMGSLVLLFILLSPRLWQVGVGTFLSAFFFLLGHGALWRKLTPQLTIRLDWFDTTRLKQMLGFSGWVITNQIGSLLFLNIDLIVANLIFGAQIAGRYGAVIIFPTLLRALLGTVDAVLVPLVVALYAQNNLAGLVRFCRLSIKFVGLAMALPIGLLCGLAKPLLTVWLGPGFADLSWLVVVLIGHLCINTAVVPLFSVQVATSNVRVPGVVTLIMGMANAGLAVALALWSGWGYISIAIAGAVVLTIKNALFTPVYNARVLRLPWWTFLPSLVTSTLAWLLVSAAAFWISLNWALASWLQLALAAAIIAGIYVIAIYFLGLGADERSLVKSEIRQRLVK